MAEIEAEIDIDELMDFFFRASANGYASGNEPKSISAYPGAKGYPWYEQIRRKAYVYSDVYFSVGNGKSFGFTLISINGEPVWYMHYYGQCYKKFLREQKVTDTLKKALLKAYQEKIFLGGRGMTFFKDKNLEYSNLHTPHMANNFGEFSGKDIIRDVSYSRPTSLSETTVFFLKYKGGFFKK